MQWMHKLRLRVFTMMVALMLLVLGVVGMFAIPVLPAVGAAIAIALTLVNTMASRLDVMTCTGCGTSISSLPAGTHGIACSSCGTINHPFNTGSPNTEEAQFVFDSDDEDELPPHSSL